VGDAFLFLGISDRPGKLQSTMEKFKLRHKKVKRAMLSLFQDSIKARQADEKLAGIRTQQQERGIAPTLPYSLNLQDSLRHAENIANSMGDSTIEQQHIFLALLRFKYVSGIDSLYSVDECEDPTSMDLLKGLNSDACPNEICEYLLRKLNEDEARPKMAQGKTVVLKKRAPLEQKEGISSTTQTSSSRSGSTDFEITGALDNKEKQESFLEQCGIDLTQCARRGELDAVHGRDSEIETCLRILARRRKNNACLVGEAGVGKTAIAEGLAQLLVSDNCPPILQGKRLMTLEISSLLAGTKFRGEFEERFRAVVHELTSEDSAPTVLFLDEIHTLVGAGATEGGGMDAANLLKPYLARGQLQLIGATTISEFNRIISKDPALERRLQPVLVREPSVDQAIGILKALVPSYSRHHKVDFTDTCVEAAVKLSDRFIGDRFLPDKAIDVLDEAGALAALRWEPDKPPPKLTDKEIASVISDWSNIPVGKLEMNEMSRLKGLEKMLSYRVKGQERAVRSVAKAIRRARTGIRNPNRPIGKFQVYVTSGSPRLN